MEKNCYKTLFNLFKVPNIFKKKHTIREKFKRDIKKYYCDINNLDFDDIKNKDIDVIWNSLEDFDRSKLIWGMKDYMFKNNYTDISKQNSVNKDIDKKFNKSIMEYKEKISLHNKRNKIIYKDYLSDCKSSKKKKNAYDNFIKDYNKIVPNVEKPTFDEWLKENLCLKDLIEENKHFEKWKEDNKEFKMWLKNTGDLKQTIETSYLFNKWLEENKNFNTWFDELNYDRVRIYDYIMDSLSQDYIQSQKNNECNKYINEVPKDKENEIILKVIIKALKHIGIEIDYKDINTALNYIENFDNNQFEPLNDDIYSHKYYFYKNKLKNLDFIKILNEDITLKKYKEKAMITKLKGNNK